MRLLLLVFIIPLISCGSTITPERRLAHEDLRRAIDCLSLEIEPPEDPVDACNLLNLRGELVNSCEETLVLCTDWGMTVFLVTSDPQHRIPVKYYGVSTPPSCGTEIEIAPNSRFPIAEDGIVMPNFPTGHVRVDCQIRVSCKAERYYLCPDELLYGETSFNSVHCTTRPMLGSPSK